MPKFLDAPTWYSNTGNLVNGSSHIVLDIGDSSFPGMIYLNLYPEYTTLYIINSSASSRYATLGMSQESGDLSFNLSIYNNTIFPIVIEKYKNDFYKIFNTYPTNYIDSESTLISGSAIAMSNSPAYSFSLRRNINTTWIIINCSGLDAERRNYGAAALVGSESVAIPVTGDALSSTQGWAMYLNICTNYTSTVSTTGTVDISTSNAMFIINDLKTFCGAIYHTRGFTTLRVLGWGQVGISNTWKLIDQEAITSGGAVSQGHQIIVSGSTGSTSNAVVSWIET